ncbi:hypothetical protein [Chitinophaga sp. Cy-1792]|uniref:hypothetical protein n=1 Tax=Chitinophaga sp. Cy-1792 TaxID=2608339 RepID=UPI00142270CA|nr:hypothetical protein [Chitinophaga sp. Cy-1792]
MRKTTAKKLTLNKIKVAKLDNSHNGDAKAPTYIGCSNFKCTPPITKDTCI